MQWRIEGEGRGGAGYSHTSLANPKQLIYCVHTTRKRTREQGTATGGEEHRHKAYAFTFLDFLATAVASAARAAALTLRRLKLRVVAAAAPYCMALLTPTQLRMASTRRAAALASALSDAKMA
jgi:hypothetical protein